MIQSFKSIDRQKPNQDIRDAIRKSPVFAYEVAAKLGISSNTLTFHLRTPLVKAEHDKIMNVISELSQEVEGSNHD